MIHGYLSGSEKSVLAKASLLMSFCLDVVEVCQIFFSQGCPGVFMFLGV